MLVVRRLLPPLLLLPLLFAGCGGDSNSGDGNGADGGGAVEDVAVTSDTAAEDVPVATEDVAAPDACAPSCGDRECGPDGCGGTCGACGDGAVCLDGSCCEQACDGLECGPDGCGGSCGTCDPRTVCLDGVCCLPDCRNRECGPDGCGGSCGTCADGGACDGGQCCVASCEGRECGSDGCGGTCGSCPSDRYCLEGSCSQPDSDEDGIPDLADPFPMESDKPGQAAEDVVYGHTATALYTMDVKTYHIERVATFQDLVGERESRRRMTDIAIDGYGVLWGVSYLRLYTCHPQTGECFLMVDLTEVVPVDQVWEFNALTMVPGSYFDQLRDVLVGVSNDGGWWRFDVDYEEHVVTVTRLGEYGMGRRSSGDAYSIVGVGTYAAVDVDGNDDFLVSLDPTTGESDPEPVATLGGLQEIFGLAGWTQHAFAFDRSGVVLVVDVAAGNTVAELRHRELGEDVALCEMNGNDVGAGNTVCANGDPIAWWGAGVRTRIPDGAK